MKTKFLNEQQMEEVTNINSMEDFELFGIEDSNDYESYEMEDSSVMDDVFNISDDDINSSLNALENCREKNDPSIAYIKKVRAKSKTKKSISEIADDVVMSYLCNRSDENWKNLQEFFWYGIRQFAIKYVKNFDDAYDMTIETFISAHNKIDTYDPAKGKFSTWLWIICRNNCLGFIREKKKKNIIDNDISNIYDSAIFASPVTNNTDYEVNDNYIIDADATQDLYDIAINEMNNIGGITREILDMKLVKNMKIREIADAKKMNESTVKNILYKGKENLSRIIKVNHKAEYDAYNDDNAYRDNEMYLQ